MRPPRPALLWTGGVLLGLMAVAAAAVVFLQTPAGERALLRLVAARAQRPIEVRGGLTLGLWSRRPRIEARDLAIGNPPWMPPGRFARLESATLTLAPTLRQPLRLHSVELRGGELHIRRRADGAANWSSAPPRPRPHAGGGGLPALRGLVVEDVRVRLEDERRHLDFDGSVATRARDDGRLQLDFRGSLNGRQTRATLEGEPLAQVAPDRPWRFRYEQRSSGTTLVADGTLPRPFRFGELAAPFEARGEDLRDLYYLVGVRLPDTGRYMLRGRFVRDGLRFEFRDLELRSGDSDLAGRIVTDASGKRRTLEAEFVSQRLRLKDVGKGAAGRAPPAEGPRRLFAQWRIPLEGLRLRDARISYRAAALEVGPLELADVTARMKIEDGVLTAAPLRARTQHGEAKGEIAFDARTDEPRATARIDAEGLELAELLPGERDAPAVRGPLAGSLELAGRGDSFHSLFGTADGTLRLTLPGGELRTALARLIGLDLRALGLALAGDDDRVPLRCAVLEAEARAGQVQLQRLVIDTGPVALSGEGSLSLRDEALDLTLRGAPKRPGLRLRSPLLVGGHLLEPAPRLTARHTAAQGAAAVVLGAALTPAAAAAAFIDPGRGKDADCPALLAPPRG